LIEVQEGLREAPTRLRQVEADRSTPMLDGPIVRNRAALAGQGRRTRPGGCGILIGAGRTGCEAVAERFIEE